MRDRRPVVFVYRREDDLWDCRFEAVNGATTFSSLQGYTAEASAKRALSSFLRSLGSSLDAVRVRVIK